MLGYSRQTRQRLVGIVYGLPFGETFEVVAQFALLNLHDGAFTLDDDGIHGHGVLLEDYVAQIRSVGLHCAEFVGQMLNLQHVGPQRRVEFELPVRR